MANAQPSQLGNQPKILSLSDLPLPIANGTEYRDINSQGNVVMVREATNGVRFEETLMVRPPRDIEDAILAERAAREKAAKVASDKAEADRKAAEDATRKAADEAARKAADEVARAAADEAARRADEAARKPVAEVAKAGK